MKMHGHHSLPLAACSSLPLHRHGLILLGHLKNFRSWGGPDFRIDRGDEVRRSMSHGIDLRPHNTRTVFHDLSNVDLKRCWIIELLPRANTGRKLPCQSDGIAPEVPLKGVFRDSDA